MICVSKWLYWPTDRSNGIQVNAYAFTVLIYPMCSMASLDNKEVMFHWWGGSGGRISHLRAPSPWVQVEVSLDKARNRRLLPSHEDKRTLSCLKPDRSFSIKTLHGFKEPEAKFSPRQLICSDGGSSQDSWGNMVIFHNHVLVNEKKINCFSCSSVQ